MSTEYDVIFKKYDLTNPNDFNENVAMMFSEAAIIDPINGIDKIFLKILRARTRDLEQVKYMIEMRANPKCQND